MANRGGHQRRCTLSTDTTKTLIPHNPDLNLSKRPSARRVTCIISGRDDKVLHAERSVEPTQIINL